MYIREVYILVHFSARPFRLVSEAADEMGVETYVIGGYVRDIFLNRPSKDIDIVVVGSGIELAKQVAAKLGRRAQLAVFKNSIRASRSWRTGRSKTTRTAAILPSMPWRCA